MAQTITATVDAGNVPPRVRIDVWTDEPLNTAAIITRVDSAGTVTEVRTYDGNPLQLTPNGNVLTASFYDYEMPYGQTVHYSDIERTTLTSGDVVVNVPDVWLINVGVPSLSMILSHIRPQSFADTTRAVSRGVFPVMGRSTPIVVTDGSRKSAESSMVVRTNTLTEFAALDALLADTSVLLLNVPASLNLGIGAAYISVGDISIARPSDIGSDELRDWTLPYTVVDRPVGGSQAQRTWADVVSENTTWSAVLAKYAKWSDVLAPTAPSADDVSMGYPSHSSFPSQSSYPGT